MQLCRRLQNHAAYCGVSTRMDPRRFAPTNRVATSARVVPGLARVPRLVMVSAGVCAGRSVNLLTVAVRAPVDV